MAGPTTTPPGAGRPQATATLRLRDIAHGRSGDKGNHANVGILAYTAAGYAFLEKELTPARVKEYFKALDPTVERFTLPKLRAFNFLLRNALGGGAAESLRTDSQGKAFATALLEMEFQRPESWQALMRPEGPAGGHPG